jgi:hypothetical protein
VANIEYYLQIYGCVKGSVMGVMTCKVSVRCMDEQHYIRQQQ